MTTKHKGAHEFDGSVTFAGSQTSTGTVTGSDLVSTDDVIVGDDLNVTGLATIGETLTVGTGLTVSAGGFVVTGNSQVAGNYTVSSYINCGGMRESNAVRTVTADTNSVVAATDRVVKLSTTGAGSRTFTLDATAGVLNHEVILYMTAAAGGGTYAAVASGLTVTLAAAGDSATVKCIDSVAGTWIITSARGAIVS